MEILAPAGNWEQVMAGVTGGCNAIYGGLKSWNARNRANNFTLHEYIEVIRYCKSKNVKFYLTLNTLLRDKEIEDILEVFSNQKFIMPDAVILNDLGLIKVLKERFPEIKIHISTQFGVHCIDDVKYLESLGVSRVILAREVVMDDIKKIKENTSLEVEVFLWGSQCVGFSGKCYWGSLVLGGSGNRGRCIGLCRNIYSYEGELGQIFYSKDLDAISKVEELERAGVCSIKIEGRMRKPHEIFNIVSAIKAQIRCKQIEVEDKYCGYLANKLPVKGLVEKVNSRIKIAYVNASEITRYDRVIRFDGDKNPKFEYEFIPQNDKEIVGVYNTAITNIVKTEKRNISLKLFVDDSNLIVKIDYINEFGERNLFTLKNKDECIQEKSIEEIYNYVSKELKDYNIYEFSFPKGKLNKYKFDSKEFDRILNDIKSNQYSCTKEEITSNFNMFNRLSVEIQDKEIIKSLSSEGIRSIIYNIVDYKDLVKTLEKYDYDKRIIYKLPLFDWDSKGIDKYLQVLEGKKIMLTRWSHLDSIKNKSFSEIHCDYTLNCWNYNSIEELQKYKIDRLTGSPELSVKENVKLVKKSNVKLEVIFAGKIPLMYSRHCFRDVLMCNTKCMEHKYILDIDKGLEYDLHCTGSHRELFYRNPILGQVNKTINEEELDITFRYITRFDDIKDVEKTVEIMLHSKNYYNSLITNRMWRNNYFGNWMESVR